MAIHAPGRVAQIRHKTNAYLKEVSELQGKVKDRGIQEQLQGVRNQFGDVEGFFLQALDRENRTAEQESRWLDYANQVLFMAAWEFAKLKDDIDRFGGPEHVQTIG